MFLFYFVSFSTLKPNLKSVILVAFLSNRILKFIYIYTVPNYTFLQLQTKLTNIVPLFCMSFKILNWFNRKIVKNILVLKISLYTLTFGRTDIFNLYHFPYWILIWNQFHLGHSVEM